ncbi:unnamed protein product [Vitrella brassicaformis CCMP3155]|uniref:RRM domain-containing protein n=2 Tax=Vitrella brassicaformis TaxID=1169539 RepID=A0A0G4EKE2_VITBC|nr:unnamed protein product [Vitrella brassicaformis CCMP3155]|mmetsp:Transcript_39544/g.99034  ORF Transcript_39544/g.99034 Transcript_39544/m.99034 type:complete len:385 (+) Transcript_39544:123-1277(+)|eukprot:CEL96892.1 unnamed protein product [Vitrella brassicaformis CCMP3155]
MRLPGASRFKWGWVKPYKRRTASLWHFPEVSPRTGQPIDWMYDTPKSGYEAIKVWGPHTLELKGMPMGKTPEYMQERLRRFFSKYGHIQHCRALPHPLDPYQCEGTAYVTFRNRYASLKALRSPLRFPDSLHNHIVRMRHLDTDKENDWQYIYKVRHYNHQILSITRQLYAKLAHGPCQLSKVAVGLYEHEYQVGKEYKLGKLGAKRTADQSIMHRFNSWAAYLTTAPFSDLFDVTGSDAEHPSRRWVRRKIVSESYLERALVKADIVLFHMLERECTVHWRKGKPPLPEYVKKNILFWDHKPPFIEELQIYSRPITFFRIYDESHLFKLRLKRERNKNKKERRAAVKQQRQIQMQQQGVTPHDPLPLPFQQPATKSQPAVAAT